MFVNTDAHNAHPIAYMRPNSMRSSQACNACRKRKVRCALVPQASAPTDANGEPVKICLRCTRMSLDCVWGEERKGRNAIKPGRKEPPPNISVLPGAREERCDIVFLLLQCFTDSFLNVHRSAEREINRRSSPSSSHGTGGSYSPSMLPTPISGSGSSSLSPTGSSFHPSINGNGNGRGSSPSSFSADRGFGTSPISFQISSSQQHQASQYRSLHPLDSPNSRYQSSSTQYDLMRFNHSSSQQDHLSFARPRTYASPATTRSDGTPPLLVNSQAELPRGGLDDISSLYGFSQHQHEYDPSGIMPPHSSSNGFGHQMRDDGLFTATSQNYFANGGSNEGSFFSPLPTPPRGSSSSYLNPGPFERDGETTGTSMW